MHIAMTVKTGDQPSLPNMDAQICVTGISNARGDASMHSHAHSSIHAIVPRILIWVNEKHEFGKGTNRMNGCFVSIIHDKLHCRGRYRVCIVEPEHQQELLPLQCGSIPATDEEAISLTCLILAGPHHLYRKQPLLEGVSIDEVDTHRCACVDFRQLLVESSRVGECHLTD